MLVMEFYSFAKPPCYTEGKSVGHFFPPPVSSLLSDSSGNSLPEFNTGLAHRQKAAGCLRCYFRGFLNTLGFNRVTVLSTVCSFWPKAPGIIKVSEVFERSERKGDAV